MKTLKTEFNSDGLILKGHLHLPDNAASPPLVVGSHGLEGSQNSAKQMVLSRLLPENGMAFFRFDHRGCGASQGEFIKDTSLERRTRDLRAAVAHVTGLSKTSRLALFGSSIGGATCINAWQPLEQDGFHPCGGVLCAAPVISRTIENIPFEANDHRPALPLEFFTQNLLFNILDKACALHHVMIFHGEADEIVPVSNAHDLYTAMEAPKKIIIHKAGSHQMTSKSDQADFRVRALDWYKKIFNL